MSRKMNNSFVKMAAVACASVGALAMAMPTTASVIVTSPGDNTLRTNFTGSVGYEFTVGASDVTVTALGIYDAENDDNGSAGDGLEQSAAVAIYHVDGLGGSNLGQVASATVPTGTTGTLVGDFRYADLASSVTLTAGETYQIMVGLNASGNGFLNYSGGTTSPTFSGDFTVPAGAYFNTGGTSTNAAFGTAPNSNYQNGDPFVGPNLQYVPEPTSLALLGVGGLLMLSRKRHKAQTQA